MFKLFENLFGKHEQPIGEKDPPKVSEKEPLPQPEETPKVYYEYRKAPPDKLESELTEVEKSYKKISNFYSKIFEDHLYKITKRENIKINHEDVLGYVYDNLFFVPSDFQKTPDYLKIQIFLIDKESEDVLGITEKLSKTTYNFKISKYADGKILEEKVSRKRFGGWEEYESTIESTHEYKNGFYDDYAKNCFDKLYQEYVDSVKAIQDGKLRKVQEIEEHFKKLLEGKT